MLDNDLGIIEDDSDLGIISDDGLDYNADIAIEENGDELPFTIMTEEERTSALAKGPIGVFEAWDRQNKWDLVPYSQSELIRSGAILGSVKRLQADEYDNPEDKEKDTKAFKDYMYKIEEEQLRGFKKSGDIFRGAIMMPGFAIELGTSLGIVGVGKKVATKAAGKVVKKAVVETAEAVAKKTAKQLVKQAAKGAVTAIGTTAVTTPIMYNRYQAKATENQIFANLALTDKGVSILKESTETPYASFVRGYADTFIEVYSEMLGEKVFNVLGSAGKKSIASKLSKETREGIFKFMNKVTPKGRIVDVVKSIKAGGRIEGVTSEILEEIVGDQLRAAFGVQDFGEQGGNTFDNMRDAIPSFDELSTMAGIFAVPGAFSFTSQTLYNKLIKRGATSEEAKNVVESLSMSEQERVYKDYISKEREMARAGMDKAFKGQELSEDEVFAMNEMYEDYVDKGWINVVGEEEVANEEKAKAIEAVDDALSAEEVKNQENIELTVAEKETTPEETVVEPDLTTEALKHDTVEGFIESQEPEESHGLLFTRENKHVEDQDLADKMVDKLIDSSDTFEKLVERMNSQDLYLRGGQQNNLADYFADRKSGKTTQNFREWRQMRLDENAKQQLTDIYNEAHGKTKPSLQEEALKYDTVEGFIEGQTKHKGSEIANIAKESETDDFLVNKIKKEDYSQKEVNIQDVLMGDEDVNSAVSAELEPPFTNEKGEFVGDINSPIIISSLGEVLDGYHRLQKKLNDGHKTIDAYVGISKKQLTDIYNEAHAKKTKPKPKQTRKQKYDEMVARLAEIKKTKQELEAQKETTKEVRDYFKSEKEQYKNSIRRYENNKENEEYNNLPNYYRTKEGGTTLDRAAADSGFARDEDFVNHLIDIDNQIKNTTQDIADINESIREETQKKVVKSEVASLKQRLADYKAGKLESIKDLKSLRKDLTKRVKKELPLGQRGKLISAINSIKDQKTLDKANERLDKVLSEFNERQTRAKAIKQAMRSYKHPEDIIDAKYQEKIEKLRSQFGTKKGEQKKSLKELTTDELLDLAQEIGELINQGKVSLAEKNKYKAMAREITRGALIVSAGGEITVEGIGSIETKKLSDKKEFDGFTRPWNALKKIFGKLGEDLFYKHFDNLYTIEGLNKQVRIRKIEEFRKKHKISISDLGKVEQIGRFSFTRNNLMSLYAQRNNEYGRKAIINGHKISEEEYKEITDYIETNLPKYAELVNEVKTVISEKFKDLKLTLAEVSNLILKEEQDYFPIYRMNLSMEAKDSLMDIDTIADFAARNPKGFDYTKAKDSFKFDRQEIADHNQTEISLDFHGDALRAINTQEHFLSFADMQKMVNSVVGDKALQHVIKYGHGDFAQSWLNDYLKNIINPSTIYGSLSQSSRVVNNYLNGIKRGLYVKYLGYNIKSAAKAIPSLFLTLPYTSLPRLIYSMPKIIFSKSAREEIRKLDPSIALMLQERDLNTYMHNLQKLSNNDVVRAFDLAVHAIGRNSMQLLINMDQFARLTAFESVYKSNLKKVGHEEAIKIAHDALIKTQPQARVMDLPSLYRTGNEMVNLVLFCSNQLNQVYNLMRYDIPENVKEGEYGKASTQVAGIMISSMLIYAITNPGKFPPDDPLEWIEALLGSAVSSVPIIGKPALSTGLLLAGDKQAFGKSSSISSIESLGNELTWAVKKMTGDKQIEGATDLVSTMLLLNGRPLPYNAIKTGIKGLIDYANGDADTFLRLIYSEYQLEER